MYWVLSTGILHSKMHSMKGNDSLGCAVLIVWPLFNFELGFNSPIVSPEVAANTTQYQSNKLNIQVE